MTAAVVLLPDTALLVAGAAGRADPAAGLRAAALAALRDVAADPAVASGPVVVVAPGRRARTLAHPVAPGLGAAGLPATVGTPATVGVPGAPASGPHADVPASVALLLLREAGLTGPVDVVEVPRGGAQVPDLPAGVALVVAVGSPSARDGEDAPLAADPRAAAADEALLAAIGDGPAALGAALDALGPDDAAALAVSGWAPWSAAVRATAGAGARVGAASVASVAGARHVVAAWLPAPAVAPAPDRPSSSDAPSSPDPSSSSEPSSSEPSPPPGPPSPPAVQPPPAPPSEEPR